MCRISRPTCQVASIWPAVSASASALQIWLRHWLRFWFWPWLRLRLSWGNGRGAQGQTVLRSRSLLLAAWDTCQGGMSKARRGHWDEYFTKTACCTFSWIRLRRKLAMTVTKGSEALFGRSRGSFSRGGELDAGNAFRVGGGRRNVLSIDIRCINESIPSALHHHNSTYLRLLRFRIQFHSRGDLCIYLHKTLEMPLGSEYSGN